jgi:hypothetical protein
MRLRTFGTAAVTLLALVVVPAGIAHADQSCGKVGSLPDSPATTTFFQSDRYMGPEPVPNTKPVSDFLSDYKRFGGMPEDQWKKQFADLDAQGHQVGWKWPDNGGFAFKADGKTVDKMRISLAAGTRLDRFGYATGQYLAKAGASFASRALPPQALVTPDHSGTWRDYEGRTGAGIQNLIIPPSNYHVYCVQNPFEVDAGPIAPFFGKAGMAEQFVVTANSAPGQAKDQANVQWLLSHGPAGPGVGNAYLVEVLP